MKSILAIIQKEFRIFFNSAIGYVFLAVFLSFSGWMFFRTFFLLGQADMRDFFLLLPWTFLFLIPSFTMRSWAEETRSGTIETLFTSGISPIKIVLAKAASIGLFLLLALALTLPFAFSVSTLGSLDWGVVWISYLGALLLGCAYISIGLLVSAITKNQIVAFLISILVCFAFYIVGEGFVTIFFPSVIGEILGQIGLGAHYKSMIRGVIDTRDIIFYVSFISLFLLANMAFLSASFWPKRLFWRSATAVTVLVAILLNIGSQFAFARFDGTANKNYTLSTASKDILETLEKPVSIKAFISSNIPAQMQSLSRDVQDMLDEYESRSSGHLELEILDPKTDEDAQNWVYQFGVLPLQLQVIERDQQQVVQAYLGLAVTTEDSSKTEFSERFTKFETLPAITDLSDFEYQLTSAIKKVSTEKLPIIGFLSDHGTKTLSNLERRFREGGEDEIPLQDVLSKNYEVRSVTLEDENLSELQTLIIAGATEDFTDEEAEKLKSLSTEGKNIIFLTDAINVLGSFTQNASTDFANILEDYGLNIRTSLIADAVNDNASFSGGFFRMSLPYPLWVKSVDLAKENAITGDLPSVTFPWVSPIEVTEKDDVNIEVLAQTSPYYQELPGKQLSKVPVEPEGSTEKSEVEGGGENSEAENNEETPEPEMKEVWTDTMISLDPQQEFGITREEREPLPLAVMAQREGEGKFLFVPNTRFITREFIQNSPENLVFMSNAIDALTIGESLISIRSKQITDRPIKLMSDEAKATIRWANVLIMPILIVIFGLVRRWLRNRQKQFTLTA